MKMNIDKGMKMKIFGKSLKEYVTAVGIFLLIVFAITVIQVVLFLLDILPLMSIDPLGLLKIVFMVWAGWVAVKRYMFELKQTIIAGLLLFIVTIWALPVFWYSLPPILSPLLKIFTLIITVFLNLAIYILAAMFGGLLAQRISRK